MNNLPNVELSDLQDILPIGEELSELAKEKQASANLPTIKADALVLVREKLELLKQSLEQPGFDIGNAVSDIHTMLRKVPSLQVELKQEEIGLLTQGLMRETRIALEPPKKEKPPKPPKPPKEPKPKAPRKKKGEVEVVADETKEVEK